MTASLRLSPEIGIGVTHMRCKGYRRPMLQATLQSLETRGKMNVMSIRLSSYSLQLYGSSKGTKQTQKHLFRFPHKNYQLRCHCFSNPCSSPDANVVKDAIFTTVRSFNCLQGSPFVTKLASAVGIIIFAVWGLGPLVRHSREIFFHKNDSSWKKSGIYELTTSYVRPMLLWTGAIIICRSLDPVVLPSEAAQLVKKRLLNFVISLSTVLAFAYCLSSAIQQAQEFFMDGSSRTDTKNMGFQFAGKAVYTAIWVAALSLFMELLGFSTQKWITAGGLGTVLLTLAGREIFTNFLSSVMIHATRPFIVNEWIQTKIEGNDVSGTVEHVGWWSPTIVRGEGREAVHVPNHKFTVNVVRNLSQKTHWRIKTHLAISHLDVSKINSIVADMRKVLAKNPQVEQQKLHRRVFLDNINPENQALMILVSCFVKTSHVEEYLCVKEAILLDLLRVIRHYRARLATPICTVQKIYSESDLDTESIFSRGTMVNRPLLLMEPSYKMSGDVKTKSENRSALANGEDNKAVAKSTSDTKKVDAKGETTSRSDIKPKDSPSTDTEDWGKEVQSSYAKADSEVVSIPEVETKDDPAKTAARSSPDPKLINSSKPVSRVDINAVEETKQSQKLGRDSESGVRRSNNVSHASSKQDVRPQNISSLEENIVLGVALEGSKRTLPIDDEAVDSVEDVKELAPLRSGPDSCATAQLDQHDSKVDAAQI